MSRPQQPAPSITTDQIRGAAAAGAEFFNLDTTLIPGNIRRQLAVLEAVLSGIASGNMVVVNADQIQVDSNNGAGGKKPGNDPIDEGGADGSTDQTEA